MMVNNPNKLVENVGDSHILSQYLYLFAQTESVKFDWELREKV